MNTLMAALTNERIRRRLNQPDAPGGEARAVLESVQTVVELGVDVNAAAEDSDTASIAP